MMKLPIKVCLASLLIVALAMGAVARSVEAAQKTLVVAIPALTENLDPDFSGALPTAYVRQWLYGDVPLRYSIMRDKNGNLVPNIARGVVCNLCEAWHESPDGLKIYFKFRPGIMSQYGNEMTSADAKWSYERRLLGPSPITKPFFKIYSIDDKIPVTIINKYTWTLNLTKPNDLIATLGDLYVAPNIIFDSTEMQKHATPADPWATEWAETHVAAFGPWYVEKYTPRDTLVLTKNPTYLIPGFPKVDRVVIREIPSETTRAALLRAGSIDVAVGLPPRLIEELRGAPGVKITDFGGNEFMAMVLNNKNPPFNDIRVRQAMAYAAPTKEIIKTVYLNKPWVKQFGGYAPDYYPGSPVTWPYKEDLAKARALLKAAGVQNLSFALVYLEGSPGAEDVGLIVKTQLAKLGISVDVQGLAPAQYNEQYRNHEATAVLLDDASWSPDPRYWLGNFFYTKARVNHSQFSDPQFDSILDAMEPMSNPAKRTQLAFKAHKILVTGVPWAFTIGTGFSLAMRSNVTGFVWFPDNLVDVRYLDKE